MKAKLHFVVAGVCDKTHPAHSVSAHIELWSEMDTKELLGTELE